MCIVEVGTFAVEVQFALGIMVLLCTMLNLCFVCESPITVSGAAGTIDWNFHAILRGYCSKLCVRESLY